jgi:hypothetical protein
MITMIHLCGALAAAELFEGELVSSDREIVRERVDDYLFENLGAPVPPKGPQPTFVTTRPDGSHQFWVYQRAPGHYEIFGIDVQTGTVTALDLAPHVGDKNAHICMFPYEDRSLYIWAGMKPGRFFRYDIASAELVALGECFPDMAYVLGYAVEDTRRMFIGAYPSTRVASVEFGRDAVRDWGRLSTDERQQYIMRPVAGADGVLYCPVGLHHPELFALDLNTGESLQILPESLANTRLAKRQKVPSLWADGNGTVHGVLGGKTFRCRRDGVDVLSAAEAKALDKAPRQQWQFQAPWPYGDGDAFRAGDWRVVQVGRSLAARAWRPDSSVQALGDGGADELILEQIGSKERRVVALDKSVTGQPMVYCVGALAGGRIYGGTIAPANTFSYEPATNTFRSYTPYFGGGSIQVYDILALPSGGLLQSSYTHAALDWFDPTAPLQKGTNPKSVAKLSTHDQERIHKLTFGPDGNVYFGTIPTKGKLGGVLGRYTPGDHSVTVWRDLLTDESLMDTAPVPETGEVFAAGSTRGGTSAIPSKTEAHALLWNCAEEVVSWTGEPVPGASEYLRAVRVDSGRIVGLAWTSRDGDRMLHYYVFDPIGRKTLHSAKLPTRGGPHLPYLCDTPLSTGEVLGIAGDMLYAVDPQSGTVRVLVRHASLSHAHGMAHHAGCLYYGAGPDLWRVTLERKAEPVRN